MLIDFRYLFGSLWLCLIDDEWIEAESIYARNICARDTNIKSTYFWFVYTGNTYIKGVFISEAYIKAVFIGVAYIGNIDIIKRSEIYLQLFQILEIGLTDILLKFGTRVEAS